ncbi:MAG: PIN domain-containing protein [Chloroflexia bacterium]
MKYALIDCFSLVYRAYHALPPELASSSGEQTNAILGFSNMLFQVMERERPDGVAVVFDVGRGFRHEESADYKAHRPSMPDDLASQLGRVRQIVAAFGFPMYSQKGYEADDVLASLAARLQADGHKVVVVTSDTDLLQIVGEHVTVVTPSRGRFSDVREYDVAAVQERHHSRLRTCPTTRRLSATPATISPVCRAWRQNRPQPDPVAGRRRGHPSAAGRGQARAYP